MPTINQVLSQLGLVLPPAPKPVASYVPYVQTGNLVVISGQLPSRSGQVAFTGKVISRADIELGQQAARLAVINALAVLQDACGGNLDRVQRIVRLGIFVQCVDTFDQQPAIANGASDLLVQIFGDKGRHARAAVGVNALPLNALVEIEMLAEITV
jgi:enamine deaminase RidA (YjgF/YER057c/UK114 family)